MQKKRKLSRHEENLAIELYRSNNRDVDKIVLELWELQRQYKKARKMAEIGSIAEKFEVTYPTMSTIFKRHGVPRHECSTRVQIKACVAK